MNANVVTLVAPFLDRIERRLGIDMAVAAVEIELVGPDEPLLRHAERAEQ